MAKEQKAKQDISNLVFVNSDKKRRAEDVYLILLGKKPKESVSEETTRHLQERFAEFMSEEDVDLKNHDEAVFFIYKKLGGAIRTQEQQARIKKQGSISKGKAAKEAAIDEDDDLDNDDEDDE